MTGDGLRVLVAGATGGIGAACVEALSGKALDGRASDGRALDGRAPDGRALDGKALNGWPDAPARVVAVDLPDIDVTLPGGAEQAVRLGEATLGGLDGIVHAVGMSGRSLGDGPVTTCTDQAWAEVLRVDLESVFRLLRAGLPALARSGGGSFVAIGSVLGGLSVDRDFLTAAYAAAKGGLVSLVQAAALEGAAHGVRVNVVAPALVDTPMARRAIGAPRLSGRLAELMPLGGTALAASDVAAAAVWLLSPGRGQGDRHDARRRRRLDVAVSSGAVSRAR